MARPQRSCAQQTNARNKRHYEVYQGDAEDKSALDGNYQVGGRRDEEEERVPVTPAVARRTRRRQIQPPVETEVVDLVSSEDEEMEAMVTDAGDEESSPDQPVTPATRLFRRQRVVSPADETPIGGSRVNDSSDEVVVTGCNLGQAGETLQERQQGSTTGRVLANTDQVHGVPIASASSSHINQNLTIPDDDDDDFELDYVTPGRPFPPAAIVDEATARWIEERQSTIDFSKYTRNTSSATAANQNAEASTSQTRLDTGASGSNLGGTFGSNIASGSGRKRSLPVEDEAASPSKRANSSKILGSTDEVAKMEMEEEIADHEFDDLDTISEASSDYCRSIEDEEESSLEDVQEEDGAEEDFAPCFAYKRVHFDEPDKTDDFSVSNEEEAATLLRVSKTKVTRITIRSRGRNNAQRIEHPDGSFEFVLHPQIEPSESLLASSVEAIISQAFACVYKYVKGSRSNSPKLEKVFAYLHDSRKMDYFLQTASAEAKSILVALLDGNISSVFDRMLKGPVKEVESFHSDPVIYLGLGRLSKEKFGAYTGQADRFRERVLQHIGNIGNAPYKPEETSSLLYQKAKECQQAGENFQFFPLCKFSIEDDVEAMDVFELVWMTLIRSFQGSEEFMQQAAAHGLPILPVRGLNSVFALSGKAQVTHLGRQLNPALDDLGFIIGLLRMQIDAAKGVVCLVHRYSLETRSRAEAHVQSLLRRMKETRKKYSNVRLELLKEGRLQLVIHKKVTKEDFKHVRYYIRPFFGVSVSAAVIETLIGNIADDHSVIVTAALEELSHKDIEKDFFLLLDPVRRCEVGGLCIKLCFQDASVYWQKRNEIHFDRGIGYARIFELLKSCVLQDVERQSSVEKAKTSERRCDPDALTGLARKLYLGSMAHRDRHHGNFFLTHRDKDGSIFRFDLPMDAALREMIKDGRQSLLVRLDFNAAVPTFLKCMDRVNKQDHALLSSIGFQGCSFDGVWESIDRPTKSRSLQTRSICQFIEEAHKASKYEESNSNSSPTLDSIRKGRMRSMAVREGLEDKSSRHNFFGIHERPVNWRADSMAFEMAIIMPSTFVKRHGYGSRNSLRVRFPQQLIKEGMLAFNIGQDSQLKLRVLFDVLDRTQEDARILVQFVDDQEHLWFNRDDWAGLKSRSLSDDIQRTLTNINQDISNKIGINEQWIVAPIHPIQDTVADIIDGRPDFFNAHEFQYTGPGQAKILLGKDQKTRGQVKLSIPPRLHQVFYGDAMAPTGTRWRYMIDAYQKTRQQTRILLQALRSDGGRTEWYDAKNCLTRDVLARRDQMTKNFISDPVWRLCEAENGL